MQNMRLMHVTFPSGASEYSLNCKLEGQLGKRIVCDTVVDGPSMFYVL